MDRQAFDPGAVLHLDLLRYKLQTITDTEVRRRAAEIIRERGWCQGLYSNEDGQVCMVGALYVASGLPPHGQLNHLPTDSAARSMGYENCDEAISWNDAPDRTVDQVLALLAGEAGT